MGLRSKVIKGGALMVIRQALGILLSLIGVLFITKVIGPAQYGLYGVSYGIVSFLGGLGIWGLDVYLLRKTSNPDQQDYNQVFTLLLCISSLFTLTLVLGQHIIAQMLNVPESAPLLATLGLTLPLSLLNLPLTIKLDRDLNFQRVAYIELISQVSYYVAALPLAHYLAPKELGAWAPAGGLWLQQITMVLLTVFSTDLRPRLCWKPSLIREMLVYGLSYSSSTWIWQLRSLVNPVIVGRFAGLEAVGFIALAIRIAEMLAFAKSVTWRLAMAALAKLENDPLRLRKSIEEGMRLQALAVGLPMAAFAIVAPVILPVVFGKVWTPLLQVFPLIAIGYIANSIFNLHSSVLYLLGKNLSVTWFHTAHIVLFAGSAFLLVPYLGMVGYGWAEIAALGSYIVIHIFIAKEIGSPNYTVALGWVTISVAVLILSTVNETVRYLSCVLLLLPLLSSKERNSLIGYFQILRS
ncbi:oligosaccharide flippase family protein [Brasilonema octagenarum]|uniref:Polysaccharide biosynthesis protein n=1 Tax=Brasilonema octagenarum UFV-OR1 TaxID=417115 RepID=A0ABX1M8I4_9CYAN|nr:polysaccharide biosynthesis protein [Brasilonema octagenarum UFV-OR1]